MTLRKRAVKNRVGKGEMHFLFFQQCFLPYQRHKLLLSSPLPQVTDPAIPPDDQGPLPGCSAVVEGACLPSPCGIKPCGEQLLVLY